MDPIAPAVQYAREHREELLENLKELLRIPSVSASPAHRPDMVQAAERLAARLRDLGFTQVALLPAGGPPVVYGEHLQAGPQAPTVLFYGHYDVQPAEPLEEWLSPPFEPAVRGENLYARGASDMKGQLLAHLHAVEALLRTSGRLPVNLKYLLDGEEESGSPNLPAFIRQHRSRLNFDVCLNGDSSILAPDQPAITYGLRGICYYELRLQGPTSDRHSGTFGGAVHNPAIVLVELLAGLHDENFRVTLPGFYDRVRPLSPEEREDLARVPMSDSWWREKSGAPALFGEKGYTATERATARPTLDVNGLLSGFTGEGSKTVLPARAMAKLSMRLVPDQDPASIRGSLEAYLRAKVPPTVKWELREFASSGPVLVERDSPAVRAAQQALEAVWGKPPVFVRQGGSVHVVSLIKEQLGQDSLLLGFGLPDDNLHAPNEKQHLPTLFRGVEAFVHFMVLLGTKPSVS